MAQIELGILARKEAIKDLTGRIDHAFHGRLRSKNPGYLGWFLENTGHYVIQSAQHGKPPLLQLEAGYADGSLDIHAFTEDALLLVQHEVSTFEKRYPGYFTAIRMYQEFSQAAPSPQPF